VTALLQLAAAVLVGAVLGASAYLVDRRIRLRRAAAARAARERHVGVMVAGSDNPIHDRLAWEFPEARRLGL
jgi:hypothetical protein